MQLGVWVAAWFRRIRLLLRNTDEEAIPVPMVVVEAGKWAVYYACEREDAIVSIARSPSSVPRFLLALTPRSPQSIYGPDDIGDTLTVEGTYKLLACLRAIGRWVAMEFKDWFSQSIAKV